MKFILSAAILATALAAASPTLAETAPAMPLICHPIAAGEKADAVAKMDGKDVMLMCEPSQMMMKATSMKKIGSVAAKTRAYGPNIDGLLTPGQIDAAWKKWTDETFHIPASTP
jgi:hypothetical protein